MDAAKKLGVLLATGPNADDFSVVKSGIDAALMAGQDVALFLMDAGVHYALDPRIGAFLDAGVEISLCAMDAEARALDCRRVEAAGVILGSQHDHARLLRDSDRFLSFT